MLDAARIAIQIAKESQTYIVIDADGLYLIQDEPELVKGCVTNFFARDCRSRLCRYKRAILTPNVVEFGRLCKALVSALRSVNEVSLIQILGDRMSTTHPTPARTRRRPI